MNGSSVHFYYMEGSETMRDSAGSIGRVYAEMVVRKDGFVMKSHHCHPYFELFTIETGGCRFLIEDEMFDIRPGDFILIPPNVLHYTRYLFGESKRCSIFFRAEDIDEATAAEMPGGADFFSEPRMFQAPESGRGDFSALLARMFRENRIGDALSGKILRAMLQELLLLGARECEFMSEVPENIHTTDKRIVSAAKFISRHFAEEITTEDVAKAVGFSPNYLSRKFKEACGLGVHGYISFIRLRHAAMELIGTDDTVTDIALRCGFSDSNYFKDAFKLAYGVTPREYRKESVEKSVLL